MSTVLVTGGSGFIASHTILQLLAAGYQVRTTVRSLSREGDVRAMLKSGGAEAGERSVVCRGGSDERCGVAGGGGWLRICASHRFAVSGDVAEG